MKFDLISDLHLNSFRNDNLKLKPKSSVLALLGDVCEISSFNSIEKFFNNVNKNWEHILYVPGNHEFYGSYFKTAINEMKRFLLPFKNIKVMDNDTIHINDVFFIGSTLWSDMNNKNPITMLASKGAINDYYYIRKLENKCIEPKDTIRAFNKNVNFIKTMLKISLKKHNVILTHHAPSYKSVSPGFLNNRLNGAFVSNLDNLILDYNNKITMWVHGHSHSKNDYMIGNCRVVSNPLGYYNEIYKDDKQYIPLTIEIV